MPGLSRKLPQRYIDFAANWVIDRNGTRSAIAAGYKEAGAHVQASILLKNPKVQRIIANLESKRASKLGVSAEKTLEEIQRLAFSNMADYTRIGEDGKPVLDMSLLTRDQFSAVTEIREDTTGGAGDGERKVVVRTTLKLADKVKSLDMLMRHLGQYNDRMEILVTDNLAERVAEGRKRKLERATVGA